MEESPNAFRLLIHATMDICDGAGLPQSEAPTSPVDLLPVPPRPAWHGPSGDEMRRRKFDTVRALADGTFRRVIIRRDEKGQENTITNCCGHPHATRNEATLCWDGFIFGQAQLRAEDTIGE